MLKEQEVSVERGRVLAGVHSKERIAQLFDVIDAMKELLDEADQTDTFGTEGWRHRIGWEV